MSKRPIYGFPCVEDPMDFSPDAECCSPAEIEAHRLACANYGKPTYEPNKGCYSEHDADGRLVKHVTRTSWGIGVNLIDHCDECGEPAIVLIGQEPDYESATVYLCADCLRQVNELVSAGSREDDPT